VEEPTGYEDRALALDYRLRETELKGQVKVYLFDASLQLKELAKTLVDCT
jgi:hypothetical protein